MGSGQASSLDNERQGGLALLRRIRDLFSQPDALILLVASLIFLGCIISPPALMDDVDAVQAQIARNMLNSGDWVTAHLDGVRYLEKPPFKYWAIALSYCVFGVHDWAARIPVALAAVLLAWVTMRFGAWAFGKRAGLYAGLALGTSVGLFLFTRVLLPDVILTLAITLALWSFARALDESEARPHLWALAMWAALATGLLIKGLVAVALPAGTAVFYLWRTRRLFFRKTWVRLRPAAGIAIFIAIALPWHVLATLRNPPYFDFTLHSGPGSYHGFFWFYFINEQLLRYLGLRYPRDYNTVPRVYFWLLHLVWLFPWTVYLPAVSKLDFSPKTRAGSMRLMAFCWIGVVLVFFSFSTTQEYYSMPCYPAIALLIGSALDAEGRLVKYGTRVAAAVAGLACAAAVTILWMVRSMPAPGDIAVALNQNPDVYAAYTLSMGHIADLTLHAFAYLRLPLAVAAIAFFMGAAGAWFLKGNRALASLAVMMMLLFHAARLALVDFDPYMGSRALAAALVEAPKGQLIVDDQYYAFSSIFFYADRNALLLNGRVTNLEYGSNAPGAPDVFINDQDFARLWARPEHYYLVAAGTALPRLQNLVGKTALHVVSESGGKYLLTNR